MARAGWVPAWGSLRTLGVIWFLGVSCLSQGWVGMRPESLTYKEGKPWTFGPSGMF